MAQNEAVDLSTHRPRSKIEGLHSQSLQTPDLALIQSSRNLGFFFSIVRCDTWPVHNEQHIEIHFLYTIPL